METQSSFLKKGLLEGHVDISKQKVVGKLPRQRHVQRPCYRSMEKRKG